MKIIGLSGKSGSGKDYIAKNHFKPLGFYLVSLADHIKVWATARGLCTFDEAFHTKPKHVRDILIQEGVTNGRSIYGDDIWIKTLMNWISVYNEKWGTDKFVITDVRFKNELEYIQQSGYVYRIVAPQRLKESSLTDEQKADVSETDLDEMSNAKFDGVIYNDFPASNYLDYQIKTLLLKNV